MTIAITGAGGFLGRACVAEARRRGLPVLALYRNSLPADWAGDVGITPLQLDLTAPDAADRLRAALSDLMLHPLKSVDPYFPED